MAFNKAKALQEAEKSVSLGKIAPAIKQYLWVFEKDPADLAILNTVGDLYVRDKNLPEALKYFHKLADSYTQEGFTVKAIAIYKKIAKLDPASVDVLIKTGELYTIQGLSREARDQYLQAVEFYKKKNQTDKVLDVFRKIVALDPENTASRMRLGEFCEQAGKKSDAVEAYVAAAESALRRNDGATAETALKKASGLESKNPQIQILRARVALSRHNEDEAIKILGSDPQLRSDPVARQILLDAYSSSGKLDDAEKMVLEMFEGTPADFSPVSTFAGMCIAGGKYDQVIDLLRKDLEPIIEHDHAVATMEMLRQIWGKNPEFLPALELIRELCEKTQDQTSLPEVLESLGDVYVRSGQLEKAEGVYRKLLEREPENESIKNLLNQVLGKEHKEGQGVTPAEIQSTELAMSAEPEPAATILSPDAGEAAMVKEALENSELYSRYGLQDKAIAELEKVLEVYPNQLDVHRRILETAQKSSPPRVAEAAEALARIHAERGELELAKKYEAIVAKGGVIGVSAIPEEPVSAPTETAASEPSAPPAIAEFDLTAGLASEISPATQIATSAMTPPQPSAPPVQEFDLSGDWSPAVGEEAPAPAPASILAPEPPPAVEVESGIPSETPPAVEAQAPGSEITTAAPSQAPAFNFEESRVEVEFYLDQGFVDEARKTVGGLEETYPGNPQVAELRRLIEERGKAGAAVEEPQQVGGGQAEWELPEAPASVGAKETSEVEEPSVPAAPASAESRVESVAAVPASSGPLEGLIGDLEAGLEGVAAASQVPVPSPAAKETPPTQGAPVGAAGLSGLLEELGGSEETAATDDTQTHYDLGVAFREMNLLDEAIGEFQKVAREARKDQYPPHFLQACTLLALCFMDKKMPVLAAKWYSRALEMPDLDEDAVLALQYDLGVAYEQAGNTKIAIEKFSEVYSQNIDYRDVAEKLRLLQQKP